MNKLRILQIIFFVVISISVISIQKTMVYGYSCLPDGYCADTGNPSGIDGFLWGWKWVYDNCYSYNWPYNCTGTDSNCSGEINLYSTQESCLAGGATDLHAGCCNEITCILCTPGAAPSCPDGTTESNTGDDWGSTKTCCDNSSGCPDPETCNTRDCDCIICTPPACSTGGYADTNQGYGSNTLLNCRNGTSSTPDRTTKCSLTPRTCYCYACVPPLCPSPLVPDPTTVSPDPNMILDNFTSCTNDCSNTQYRDCYETPSPQPVETLVIRPDVANDYGFSSDTHTGIPQLTTNTANLNDPINMTAKYTDTNGASDIEALGVWFREDASTGEVQSPIWMSTTAVPDAPSNGSWGFMMVRESGTWVPYVPSWAPATPVWTRATYTNSGGVIRFFISGPSRGNMVAVTITAPITSSGDTVTMPFSLKFSGTNIVEPASQTTYKILLMGLDVFSFTPYDNYPGVSMDGFWSANKLRYRSTPPEAQTYARDWFFTDRRWTIDKIAPEIQFINDTPSVMGNTLKIEWSATDDKSLYAIVGNIFMSSPDGNPISILDFDGSPNPVILRPNLELNEEFVPTYTEGTTILPGNLDTGWDFKVEPNIGGTTHTGSLILNIGEQREGVIVFYLTAFDDAGNIDMPDNGYTFNLNDWIVTDGGVLYSEGGTGFETRDDLIEDPTFSWTGILPPYISSANDSLTYPLADLSSELLSDGLGNVPLPLKKSNITGSYSIGGYKISKVTSYYDTLLKAFERNKVSIEGLKDKIILGDVTLNSQLTDSNYCGNINSFPYCSLKIGGNLTINGNGNLFRCASRAVLFVEGNLTIIPPIINTVPQPISESLGCIFVVKGNVSITEGGDADTSGFAYDVINGYIFADGSINVEHENSKLPDSSDDDIIDTADAVSGVWASSDPANTGVSLETTFVQEGTGSVKIEALGNTSNTTLDLMEYPTNALANIAYPGGGSVYATGGTVTITADGYRVHKFNSNNTLTVTRGGNMEVLIVGGGGGGGVTTPATYSQGGAGAGGAGGHIYYSSFFVNTGAYTVAVGAGGATQTKGSNSTFSTLVALGGGRGDGDGGGDGGSGGGGSNGASGGIGSQGRNGGRSVCSICGNATAGGGGGGGSTSGSNSRDYYGGNGGTGVNYSIISSAGAGVGGYVAGGGGGAGWLGRGTGGTGGGGRGASNNPSASPRVGVANTGGGGGGGIESGYAGAAGGSGIALMKYLPYTGVMIFSEPTIKQQGSYALKVVADQTASLGKTVTRVISNPITLTDHNLISFYMQSSRTGSNVKIGFRDSGGVITEITPNILAANTYQLVTLDLSGVTNANKDAIDRIIITIVNANSNNTFYLDNIVASKSASLNDTVYTTNKPIRDMSDYDGLKFWGRASKVGTKMRFQFSESNSSVYRVFDFTINEADKWVPITWYFSNPLYPVSATERNSVDDYAFKILNLEDNESFYFDEIKNINSTALETIDYGEVIDGVYINGGLQSFGGITIDRYLRLEERLKYPVLAVDLHSKYGSLAREFFGNTFVLQKTEVGFKP